MTLKARILIFTMAGLAAILTFYTLLIYVFFVRTTTDAEVRFLWNRAQTILRKPEVRQPAMWAAPDLLEEFMQDHMMLRIIGPDQQIHAEVRKDLELEQLIPVYRKEYHTRIIAKGSVRVISIQVPILMLPERQQVGVLELTRSFSLFRGYLRLLLLTLGSGFVIGLLFSVLIAVTYVRWIFKPVAQLAGTMERIERSGSFDRLAPDYTREKDEFGRLGQTFNRMMARLENNYERQRHFVQNASHELRTPLTVIRSYAGLLRRWGGDNPALREEAVEAIEQEAVRLKELVEGLLLLADTEENTGRTELGTVKLWKLIARTAGELSRTFGRTVELEADESARNAVVLGNPLKLKQLLIILLDNAMKYSTEAVTVRLRAEEEEAVLEVEDRGEGIAPEHLGKLFDRFYRADQARNRKTGGSGLGLSIAKKIVEEHGGGIEVRSRLGQGTLMTARLKMNAKSRP
ncbi:sensor histidine kinase [Gorillibacterium sp. sgz5001074]|uniref:sensor histidine kinase n=1 Tax=Gorillibacterium sp. sgz5001074 TaxID=3446695 RepID=UPI003F661F2D